MAIAGREVSSWWRGLFVNETTRLAAIVGQLLLIALVVRAFQIETVAFRRVFILACVGFLIHHFLPLSLRQPCFVGLSLLAAGIVLGFVNLGWLVAIGMMVLGVCHLPLAFGARVVILAGLGVVLAAMRAEWIQGPIPAIVWPVFGSMFMFRVLVYLYDLKNQAASFSFWRALAYFFMLPNVCFPLFPVVDYKTFGRNYFNEERLPAYQLGVRWILRGVVHLVLYRLVYRLLHIGPSDVHSLGSLFQFAVGAYLLYLRVSGQFHIIAGMLRLFGYNLPETNHLYLLASSFTDFWRRINIYWKEFITKLVFYPVYFRLKRLGHIQAMIWSTLAAFGVTWALHSYQWFWLRGTFPITGPDVMFWGVLGLLVIINVLYENHFGPRRSLTQRPRGWVSHLGLVGRTLGTFLVISLLWSAWYSDSLGDWFALLTYSVRFSWSEVGLILAVLGVLGACAVAFRNSKREGTVGSSVTLTASATPFLFWRSVATVLAMSIALLALSRPGVRSLFGSEAEVVLDSLRKQTLNVQDIARVQRGYYEDLGNVDRFNDVLQAAYDERPTARQRPWSERIERPREDYLELELTPLKTIDFKGVPMTANQYGMRDRDYSRVKPAGVYRVALIGSSRSMGWGVGNEETFETLVENELNQRAGKLQSPAFEILNFSMNGYGPIPKLLVLENKALSFQPDAVFYISHSKELDWIVTRLAKHIRLGTPLPYTYLDEVARKAHVDGRTREIISRGRLKPFAPEMLAWTYRRFVKVCRDRGMLAVWIYVPDTIREWEDKKAIAQIFKLAESAGFLVVDLSNAYGSVPSEELRVSPYDDHPNVTAHRLLAECLLQELKTNPATRVFEPEGAVSSQVDP